MRCAMPSCATFTTRKRCSRSASCTPLVAVTLIAHCGRRHVQRQALQARRLRRARLFVDLASAMHDGCNNTIVLRPYGPRGANATIFVADRSARPDQASASRSTVAVARQCWPACRSARGFGRRRDDYRPCSDRERPARPRRSLLPHTDDGAGVTGWETAERVLDSGGFESRQRVLVSEPVVEASESGARWLGIAYWQAVDRLHAAACARAGRTTEAGSRCSAARASSPSGHRSSRSTATLVSCRYAIQGGLLALRAGGSVTLAQRRDGDQHELSVTVEEYLPRLAARARRAQWTGTLYAKGQSPLHAAVSRRYFELLPRGPACEGHGLWRDRSRRPAHFSRSRGRPRADRRLALRARTEPGVRWVEADAAAATASRRAVEGAEVVYYLVHSLGQARLRAAGSRSGGDCRERRASTRA